MTGNGNDAMKTISFMNESNMYEFQSLFMVSDFGNYIPRELLLQFPGYVVSKIGIRMLIPFSSDFIRTVSHYIVYSVSFKKFHEGALFLA